LALALRSGREQQVPTLLLAIGIIGLACSEAMLGVSPQAGFYLMPFRIFELSAGAAMAWLVDRQPNDGRVHELLVVMGVVLVLYPVFVYTNATPFPGTNALPTVVGTALLIYSGSARYAGRILNNPVAVGVGLVSYSLYLVHWPPAPTPNNAMKLLQKRRIPEETIRALILRIDETPMPPTSTM
jgi:peptidoglycan/LPS O-acetylase OafA/YrhL